MNEYIVASSRDWHQHKFQDFTSTVSGSWRYVDSVDKLKSVIAETTPRYIFFLHWSSFVPAEIFERYECVCFHMTDVPYGRGGSPLQNLIIDGKTDTMVTALRMERDLDAGPVYYKLPMSLEGRAEDIYLRAGDLCWEMIRSIISLEPTPLLQEGEAKLFRRRKPEQSVLPPAGSLADLYDHIRMLDAPGYPLSFIQHGDFCIQFSHAELKGNELQACVVIRKM